MFPFKSALTAWIVCVSFSSGALAGSGRDIYPESARAASDVRGALAQAATEHKRVILDFGGNWCTDCLVLDSFFHDAANQPLLSANYLLVHINVGHMTENADIAARYQIPLHKGVPALAVLDETGSLLYSQKTGEFQDMRHMDSASVSEFLRHWKKSS